MNFMTENEFIALSKKGNLVPVYKEIYGDLETPVAAYIKLASKSKYSFLLESVEGSEKLARYSFLSGNPELVFRTKGTNAEIIRLTNHKLISEKITFDRSPLEVIRKLISRYNFVNIPELPRFCGGLVGYMSYDTIRFFEKIPNLKPDEMNLADVYLMMAKDIVIFDHLHHTIKLVSCVEIDPKDTKSSLRNKFALAQQKISKLATEISKPLPLQAKKIRPSSKIKVTSNMSKAKFCNMINKAKEEIKAGEIIQVVLSQRFEANIKTSPIAVYRTLRTLNPSPYMYMLNFNDFSIVGSSPELLVRCESGLVSTRPIAGTRPRGRTPAEDEVFAKDLLNDPKELAEHVMLVDLGRNDLGRVCQNGTVKVTDLMSVERYSHVMHIVSNVQGKLSPEHDSLSALEATFPAGTLSGAPKIRAMEIIEQLEPSKRGPYGGCIGYISFSQDLDTCITIRTIVIKGNKAYIQAGAGIVADSDPKTEYIETVNKAKAQVKALELAHSR